MERFHSMLIKPKSNFGLFFYNNPFFSEESVGRLPLIWPNVLK